MTDPVESRARAALDAAHLQDPKKDGGRPAEALYADRIEAWVKRLVAEPSLALRLASRGQHLERWVVERSEFALGRGGYLRWRASAQQHQAERARTLLRAAGCNAALAERVASLVAKTVPRKDPEAQALE